MDFKSRRGCQIAKCAFAAVLGVTVYVAREWLLRTDFAPRFSEGRFRSLEVGYPPRDVLTALGEPFSVAIHYLRKSENGENITDGSSMPLVLEGSKPFIHYAEDPKFEVVLNYSKAHRDRDIFRARQIVFRNGRVAELAAYNLWGD